MESDLIKNNNIIIQTDNQISINDIESLILKEEIDEIINKKDEKDNIDQSIWACFKMRTKNETNKIEKEKEEVIDSDIELYDKIEYSLKEENRIIESKMKIGKSSSPMKNHQEIVKNKENEEDNIKSNILKHSRRNAIRGENINLKFKLELKEPKKNINLKVLKQFQNVEYKRREYNKLRNEVFGISSSESNKDDNINYKKTKTMSLTSVLDENDQKNKNINSQTGIDLFNFCDFYDIDEINDRHKSKLNNPLGSIDNKELFTSRQDIYKLLQFIDDNNIKIISRDKFELDNFWYKHRDYVFFGHLNEGFYINESQPQKVYIKKINIRLKKYIENVYSEIKMLIELKKSGLFQLNSLSLSCYPNDKNFQLILNNYTSNKDKNIKKITFNLKKINRYQDQEEEENKNKNENFSSNKINVNSHNSNKSNIRSDRDCNNSNWCDSKNGSSSSDNSKASLNNYFILDDLIKINELDNDLSLFLIFDSQFISFDQFVKKNKKARHKYLLLKHLLKTFLILHSRGIVYLDLRPEMIQLDKSLNIRIFDFYNARKSSEIIDSNKIFYSPYFSAPEITFCTPKIGWAQDIYSIGCIIILLFLDYNKYDESSLKILQKRIFNTTPSMIKEDLRLDNKNFYTRVPKIPKVIKKEIAEIIQKCFKIDPLERVDIVELIKLVNNTIFKENMKGNKLTDYVIVIKSATESSFEKYKEKMKFFYMEDRVNKSADAIEKMFKKCKQHQKLKKDLCSNCDKYICEACRIENHNNHIVIDCDRYYDISEIIYFEKLKLVENKFLNINFFEFLLLESFFINDYEKERGKIETNFNKIIELLSNLKYKQIELLDKSKSILLNSKFKSIFTNSDKIKLFYKEFYIVKSFYLSLYRRFEILLTNKLHINSRNYSFFIDKFEKYYEYSEILKSHADKMIENSCESKIKGKYKFTNEKYTSLMLNSIIDINKRQVKENHKFFDYAGKDVLFIPKEVLTIIPNTNKVFSYMKNNFKILPVNFDVNNIKIKGFLPGCASALINDMVYITGGELNDDGSRFSFYFSITQKIANEISELNILRRYHTMISLNSRFICCFGGWNSCDVEYYDTLNDDIWRVFHKMNYERADPTVCLVNSKWIYVFGGWNFSLKKCLGTIERYLFFESSSEILFHGAWENINIKSDFSLSISKYNMGILMSKENSISESYILIGGCDESLGYSKDIVNIEIDKKSGEIKYLNNNKLPDKYEASFWYEKEFQILQRDDGSFISVIFDSLNYIFVYDYNMKEFRRYENYLSFNRNKF